MPEPIDQRADGAHLKQYWAHGEGAAKVRWGQPGDFDRCVRAVTSAAGADAATFDVKGFCARAHHDALGKWPGQEHAKRADMDPARIEYRSRTLAGTEIRADGTSGRRFLIRALPYRQLDTYRTDFDQGVFNQFLDEDPPVLAFGHVYTDIGQILGRMVDYTDRPEALEQLFELDDFDAVPNARQASAQLRSGTLRRFSVGFERLDDIPHPEVRGAVRITKGHQVETSIVLDPSVMGTKVLAMRMAERGLPFVGDALEVREAAEPRITMGWLRELAGHLDMLRDAGVGSDELRSIAREVVAEGTIPDLGAVAADGGETTNPGEAGDGAAPDGAERPVAVGTADAGGGAVGEVSVEAVEEQPATEAPAAPDPAAELPEVPAAELPELPADLAGDVAAAEAVLSRSRR